MARSCLILLIIILIALVSYMPSSEASRPLRAEKKDVIPKDYNSVSNILPVEQVHAITANNKPLMERNLAETERLLVSVPSPGIGN